MGSDDLRQYLSDHAAAVRASEALLPDVQRLGQLLCERFAAGNKLLTFGNGGSAADAQHLAEELIGRFLRDRRPLPAIALTSDGTALTCIANDYGFADVFARQVTALAKPGDLVVGISTSGHSENVLRGFRAAAANGATTIALLGRGGGKALAEVDHALVVPSETASIVQEMHIVVIHMLCEIVDRWAAHPADGRR